MNRARIAGIFYLITFATGIVALGSTRGSSAWLLGNLVGDVSYVAVTILFYELFEPVNRNLSLIAAFFSLTGCAIGILNLFDVATLHISPLVLFGIYCLLIGYLIYRSTFLPRILGMLMAFGGLGWLTFISPPFANSLAPYTFAPGMIGEGALMLWLVAFGVNAPRWQEQAAARAHS